jgi:hypothetical protein
MDRSRATRTLTRSGLRNTTKSTARANVTAGSDVPAMPREYAANITASKIKERRTAMRSSLWPSVVEEHLWRSDRKRPGYTMVPRTMQLIMTMMDTLSKGKPVSSAYFDLWCRAFDEQFVSLNRPREMAFYAGFNGERAQRTWLDRVKILEQLGFIQLTAGPSGPYSYALILNPYHVLAELNRKGQIPPMYWNALLERVSEIGAVDLKPTTE